MSTLARRSRETGIRRDVQGRWVAGVCLGLGRRYGIDPTLFRVAFLILAIFGGVGLPAYLVAWLVLPADDATIALERAAQGDGIAITLGAITVLTLVTTVVAGFPPSTVLGLLALAGIGWWLVRRDAAPGQATMQMPMPMSTTSVPTQPVSPLAGQPAGTLFWAPGDGAPSHPSAAGTPSTDATAHVGGPGNGRGRRARVIGALIGAACVLAACVLAVVFLTGVTSRSREPGHTQWRPTTAQGVAAVYQHGAGPADLDLRAVPNDGTTHTTRVDNGTGDVTIHLPAGTSADIAAQVGTGSIVLQGADGPRRVSDGVGLHEDLVVGSGPRLFDITAYVGTGTLTIVGDDRPGSPSPTPSSPTSTAS